MSKYLPKSRAGKEAITTIINDLAATIQAADTPAKTRESLWKVLFFLPRFIFFIPVASGGTNVGSISQRARLFVKGEADTLWRMGHDFGISSIRYELSHDDTSEIFEGQDEEVVKKEAKKWEQVSSALEVGEISKAAELANPIWRIANVSPGNLEAHATELFEVSHEHARDEMASDVEVFNLAESLLQEAINNGECASIEEAETFEGKHVSEVAGGFKYTSPPDRGGWRPSYMKYIVKTLNLGGGAFTPAHKDCLRGHSGSSCKTGLHAGLFRAGAHWVGKDTRSIPTSNMGKMCTRVPSKGKA